MKKILLASLLLSFVFSLVPIAHAATPLPWIKTVSLFSPGPGLTKDCVAQGGVASDICYNASKNTFTPRPGVNACSDPGTKDAVRCVSAAAPPPPPPPPPGTDTYGWSMFFNVTGADGKVTSTQYFSKTFTTSALCTANAQLSATDLKLPTGAVRDQTKPVTCNCSATLATQGAACDVAKFTAAQQQAADTGGGGAGGGGPSGPIGGFVSLTKIAAFDDAGNSAKLPDFLNNLYKICIGIAAVLAVLQIMRAGVMYMGGDSVTEKSQAKSIITQSLLGLLLVLSPTIIFGIINKDILSLKINNLDKLQVLNSASQAVADSVLWSDDKSTYGTASVRCLQEGGGAYPVALCRSTGSTEAVPIPSGGTCTGTLVTICKLPAGKTPTASCDIYKQVKIVTNSVCDGAAGFTRIDPTCSQCSGASTGSTCCGSTQAATP